MAFRVDIRVHTDRNPRHDPGLLGDCLDASDLAG